jgi:acyl carrier protein
MADPMPNQERWNDAAGVQRSLNALLYGVFETKGCRFDPAIPLREQDFDSLDTVAFLSELERCFDITLDDDDLTDANFRDLASLVRLICRKAAVPR